jgi:hypothetical protein
MQGPSQLGSQGFNGTQGNGGTQGPFGFQGPVALGPQGFTGTQGFGGMQGLTGSGAQGFTGTQGISGPQGTGPQGASQPGPQGNAGPQGMQGDIGFQGPTAGGPQGLDGPQGPVGDIGPQGGSLAGMTILGTTVASSEMTISSGSNATLYYNLTNNIASFMLNDPIVANPILALVAGQEISFVFTLPAELPPTVIMPVVFGHGTLATLNSPTPSVFTPKRASASGSTVTVVFAPDSGTASTNTFHFNFWVVYRSS